MPRKYYSSGGTFLATLTDKKTGKKLPVSVPYGKELPKEVVANMSADKIKKHLANGVISTSLENQNANAAAELKKTSKAVQKLDKLKKRAETELEDAEGIIEKLEDENSELKAKLAAVMKERDQALSALKKAGGVK